MTGQTKHSNLIDLRKRLTATADDQSLDILLRIRALTELYWISENKGSCVVRIQDLINFNYVATWEDFSRRFETDN